jgi:Flp pilus assembly protein TadG
MVQAKSICRLGVVDFLHNKRGNVAIIFGLSVIPTFTLALMTVDFTRLAIARSRMQQAVDAAALQAATKITSQTTDEEALRQAAVYVKNNYPSVNAAVSAQNGVPVISANRTTLCIQASGTLQTTAAKLVGVATMTPFAKACANLAGGTNPNMTYEIALVLDNSGSMGNSAGGVSKIQALRSAAKSFTETMFSKVTSGKLQMSITPFNAAVVAVDPTISANRTAPWIDTGGDSSLHWNVFGGSKAAAAADGFHSRFDIYAKLKAAKSSWDWNGCFEPQPYPMDVNDTPPTTIKPDTLFVPYLSPDEPNSGGYLDSYVSDGSGSCSTGSTWTKLIHTCKYKNPSSSGSGKGPDGVCPSQPSQTLMQLTSTQTDVTDKIGKLVDGGTTNLHEGFMWGWRTISPSAPFAAGKAYDAENNRKVIIFMTDGYNNWKSNDYSVTGSQYEAPGYYSLNGAKNVRLSDGTHGDGVNYQTKLAAAAPNVSKSYSSESRDALDDLTLEACTNAKALGIEIFTIGFSTSSDPIDQQGLDLMKACATNADHYFAAANADQLNAVFAAIGTGLGRLKLSL